MKIKYKSASEYKYQLVEEWSCPTNIIGHECNIPGFVKLQTDGLLLVGCGYSWDGASGPTIDSKNSMRASLAHDALYQLERSGLLPQKLRRQADNLFYQLCVADGMWKIRAKIWLWAVRKFAAKYAKKKDEVIFEAP